jgi:hypothetical protein
MTRLPPILQGSPHLLGAAGFSLPIRAKLGLLFLHPSASSSGGPPHNPSPPGAVLFGGAGFSLPIRAKLGLFSNPSRPGAVL